MRRVTLWLVRRRSHNSLIPDRTVAELFSTEITENQSDG